MRGFFLSLKSCSEPPFVINDKALKIGLIDSYQLGALESEDEKL